MIKLRSLITCMVVCCVRTLLAYTETVNGITWTYTVVDGAASVGGSASSQAVPTTTIGEITIPSRLGNYPVTSIGQRAFGGCTNLTGITIPSSVINIGRIAFADCNNLRCVTIPNSVTSIGESAFSGCSELIEISVDSANTIYKSENGLLLSKDGRNLITGVGGNIVIPDDVTNIVDYAFYSRRCLTEITILDNVTSIGYSAFRDCSELTEVRIPNSVTSIGGAAFEGCSNLDKVTIPNGVTNIGIGMFWGCNRLMKVRIPASVISIDQRAFYSDSSLNVVVFEGHAPRMNGTEHFMNVSPSCTAYVLPSSTGWGVAIPGTWNGINIDYLKSVEFDANGGVVTADVRWLADGDEVGELPIPTRTGCCFDGWYTEKSGGTQIDETTIVSSNTTFYAVWESLAPVFTPVNGTTFDNSLSISIASEVDGATIHYTTDGTDPTIESPVYRRFRIYGKTTVKAIAEKDGMLSEVVTAEYALGRCVAPIISLADGTEFAHSNQTVSIRWNNDGVLRYTLDGSEPTAVSPIYEGPFTVNDSVVVKAKVFSDDFFDSAVVTSSLARVWENVATPAIEAATSFSGSKAKVVISCATRGALIYYTLNGDEPDSSSSRYTGPLYVTDSCTVKAYAEMPDYLDSATTTQEITKVWGIGDTMGRPDHGFTTDGSTGWTRVVDATAPNGEAMKSGVITHNQSSVLSTTVMGPGTLSFSWRTSCEDDPQFEWDHAECAVGGTVVRQLCGVTAWTNEYVEIVGDGEHTVEWRYVKDEVESAGEDAAWVANYQWTSAWTATRTTEVPVPYAWLTAHDPGVVDEYESYEASAKATAVNGHKTWECYVLGLDPQNVEAFRITTFQMKADGTPDLNSIAFTPEQEQWNVPGARPVVQGAAALDGEWQTVTEENKAGFRFFKVVVEVP